MAQKSLDRRGLKVLLSSSFVIIAAFMSYPGLFGRRTRGDEANLALDIHHLIREGSKTEFIYGNGQAFLTFVPTILHVLGLPYSATNALSPFIAALCLSVILTFLYIIYRGESGDWLGIVPIAAGFFSFAGFIGVLLETSHKVYIHTIVFMILYLTWRFYRKWDDGRQTGLLVGLLSVLSFFNIFWAMIYSAIFVLALLLEGVVAERIRDLRILLLFPALTILTIVFYFPTVTRAPLALLVRLRWLFEGSATPSTSAASAGGLITGWPMVVVFGNELSVWFIYTAGIFVIGAISAVTFFIAIFRIARRESKPFDRLLIIVLSTFGMILLGLAGAGTLPAFRRLLVFPGIVGLMYWMVYVSEKRESLSSPNYHTILAVATVAIICTSAVLAVPRLTSNGHNTPYDHFSDEADISRVGFALQNQQSDCLISSEEQEQNIAKVVFGKPLSLERPIPPPDLSTYDKVYSSKAESGLYC